jgi:hypothetical protein
MVIVIVQLALFFFVGDICADALGGIIRGLEHDAADRVTRRTTRRCGVAEAREGASDYASISSRRFSGSNEESSLWYDKYNFQDSGRMNVQGNSVKEPSRQVLPPPAWLSPFSSLA